MKPAIRFIVDTITHWPRNGSPYRFARIRSTISGRSLYVSSVGGAQNIPGKMYKALAGQLPDPWSTMHYQEIELPTMRQWDAAFQSYPQRISESDLTAAAILALEEVTP